MVGYALLIVIAVSLSVIVYAFLIRYVWRPPETCDEGVSLIVEDYNCDTTANLLNLTVKNQGRYSLDGFMIHGSNKTVKWFAMNQATESELNEEVLFEGDRLNASMSRNFLFDYTEHNSINRIEIKPLQAGKKLIVCENAIINQDVRGCD